MPEMIRVLALVVATLSACSHRPAAQAPAAPAPGPSASADTPPADARPATAAPAPAADGHHYRYGKLVTEGSDDRNTCVASADAARACSCELQAPPMYWEGEPRCSGIPTREDPKADQQRTAALAVPACMCTCDDAYKAAAAAYHKRLEDCSRVP